MLRRVVVSPTVAARRGLSTAVAAGTLTVRQRLKSTPIDHRVLAHIQELGLGRRGVGNPRAQDAKLLRRRLQKRFGFVQAAHAPEELPAVQSSELAFAGRSNVGKSSLLNALLGKNCGPRGTIGMAAVENKPGSTRSVNFYAAPGVDGREVGAMLVDLPGYGFALAAPEAVEAWQATMRAYLGGRGASPPRVLVLVDARQSLRALDRDMLLFLDREARAPHSVVLTKCDLVDPLELCRRYTLMDEELRGLELKRLRHGAVGLPHMVSARSGAGIIELRNQLIDVVPSATIRPRLDAQRPNERDYKSNRRLASRRGGDGDGDRYRSPRAAERASLAREDDDENARRYGGPARRGQRDGPPGRGVAPLRQEYDSRAVWETFVRRAKGRQKARARAERAAAPKRPSTAVRRHMPDRGRR